MIYTVTCNPALDYILDVPEFQIGVTNRTVAEKLLPGGKGINVSLVLKNLGLESRALGFAAGFLNVGNLADSVRQALSAALTASAPWGIPVTNLIALGIGWGLYAKAKGLYRTWDGEDEDTIDAAEEQLSWALLMSAVALLCDLFFFSVAVVYAGSPAAMGAFIVEFFVGVGVATVLQQKVVDLTKKINPEKRGSVYDMQFQKKWMDSCDESEQRQTGQACYKAYLAATKVCLWIWVALMVFHFAFGTGLLPAAAVLAVFGVLQITYTLESIRLGRKGGAL